MKNNEKKPTRKKVRFELIPAKSPIYSLMRTIISKYHGKLKRAKIALVWDKGIRPDKDGHIELGRCHKTGDAFKEFAECDFIITLNKEMWNHKEFTKEMCLALLDHELLHAAPAIGKDGHQKRDERKRYCWRMRDHDVEEFHEIVERHGIWKYDLERFAQALLKAKRRK